MELKISDTTSARENENDTMEFPKLNQNVISEEIVLKVDMTRLTYFHGYKITQ